MELFYIEFADFVIYVTVSLIYWMSSPEVLITLTVVVASNDHGNLPRSPSADASQHLDITFSNISSDFQKNC